MNPPTLRKNANNTYTVDDYPYLGSLKVETVNYTISLTVRLADICASCAKNSLLPNLSHVLNRKEVTHLKVNCDCLGCGRQACFRYELIEMTTLQMLRHMQSKKKYGE